MTGEHSPSRRKAHTPGILVAIALLLTAGVVTGLVVTRSGSRPGPTTRAARSPTTTITAATRLTARGVTASWVQAENSKPGSTGWNITGAGNQSSGTNQGWSHHSIEGYADHVSVQQGDIVKLYVSTTAATFHVEAYRMGWYGGKGGRLVWTSAEVRGVKQAPPGVSPGTNTVECVWQPSLSVPIPGNWPQGDYLLKLVGNGGEQYRLPLTIRDDASSAAYVIQNSVTTWQAYNLWGGYDLYKGGSGSTYTYANRSRAVSFDRPYDFAFGGGAADFVGNELPLVQLAERMGLDVTYWTDVDLHERPQLLPRHKVLISLGHDEYWSAAMRQGVVTAMSRGVNLAFLGANAIYRHIRFAQSPLGPDRLIVCYKVANEDPLYGRDNADVTSDWPSPPDPMPESEITGDMYECNPVSAPMVVSDPLSWLLAGSGLQAGAQLADLVGTEYDRYIPSLPGPSNIEVLAHSPLRCRGAPSYSDMTYYTASSGAGVFATGTNRWVASLGDSCSANPCPSAFSKQVTENMLAAFGGGPTGSAHPARPNWRPLPGYGSTGSFGPEN